MGHSFRLLGMESGIEISSASGNVDISDPESDILRLTASLGGFLV